MVGSLKLTRNLLLLYLGEGAAKVLGLVAFGHLARSLGKGAYGDIEFAAAVLFILNLVQEAGLAPYGAREGARNPSGVPALARTIITLRGLLILTSWLLMGALVLALDKPWSAEVLVILYGLVLLPAPFVLNWVFQSRDETGVIAGANVIRQVVLAGGVLLCVRASGDAWMVPCFDALGLALGLPIQHFLLRRRVGPLRLFANLGRAFGAETWRVLREALPLAGSSLAWAARIFAPLVLLGVLVGSEETARFGSGHRLVVALHTFVWLYFFNLLPSLSRSFHGGDLGAFRGLLGHSLRLVSWTVIPGCIALSALSWWLLPTVFGTEFQDAGAPFAVQVWMLALAFISGHQRYGLIAAGYQREEMKANLAGAIVSIAACLAYGARLRAEEAVVIFVVSECVTLACAQWFLGRRVGPAGLLRAIGRPMLLVVPLAAVTGLWLHAMPWVALAVCLATVGIGLLVVDRGLLKVMLAARPGGIQ